jgi:type VI secretion system secreted protein VgrG
MRRKILILLAFAALAGFPLQARAGSILGSSASFAVLGASTVTNTGNSVVGGDLGVYAGTAITGFPPGTVTAPYTTHAGDAVAQTAQSDANTAYNGLAAMPSNTNLTGQDLGGLTLTSGVYTFNSSAQLTGTLTLNAQGLNNAYWVFQIGSTLTTASMSAINIINVGSHGGSDDGLFWQVGSSATLGTTTAFEGNILAQASITLNTGANIDNGRAIALTGAVTMDDNTVNIASPPPNNGPGLDGGLVFVNGKIVPIGPSSVPEPGTFVLLGSGLVGLLVFRKRVFAKA